MSATAIRTASITDIVPGVQVRMDNSAAFAGAVIGQNLQAGSSLRTDTTGQASLTFLEGSIIRIGTDTDFELQDLGGTDASPTGYFRMSFGEVLIRLQAALGQGDFTVETPAGVASVRGSVMGVRYRPESDSTDVMCLETSSTCSVQLGAFTVTLRSGQRVTIINPSTLTPPEPISREDLREFAAEVQAIAHDILSVVFPNGTPTAGPTRTPLPTVTPPGGASPTATSTSTSRPPTLLPTFTPTSTPTRTSTPTPTKTCVPSTIPCA